MPSAINDRATAASRDLDAGCRTLGMMAKYWIPGRVKTRLARAIGTERSAELHRTFVIELADRLGAVADRRQIALDPFGHAGDVAAQIGDRWEITDQGPGDLGHRMSRWFRRRLAGTGGDAGTGCDRAILIGADCLTIGPADIDQAFDQLRSHDVVLGPSRDGGYYLIGLRAGRNGQRETLFRDVAWGTAAVLATTLRRAAAAGLRVAQLPPREDVDTIDELRRLAADVHATDAHGADDPRMARLRNALADFRS